MKRSVYSLILVFLFPVIALAGKTYTATDFQRLKALAQTHTSSYARATALKCKTPLTKKPSLREEINSYLMIAELDLVGSGVLPALKTYSEKFIPLLETAQISYPRLTLSANDNFAIMTLIRENRPVIFKDPKKAPLDPLVETYRGKMPLSYVMLLLLDKIQVATPQCGMTAAENDAIVNYTGFGYDDLNPYLRNRTTVADDLDRLELILNRALSKLADYKGYVYRSTTFAGQPDMPQSVYREHKAGKILTYAAFTSTSPFLFEGVNFLIYSKTGKNVSILNDHESGEVLFRSGTRFQVLYNSCEEERKQIWQNCDVLLSEGP